MNCQIATQAIHKKTAAIAPATLDTSLMANLIQLRNADEQRILEFLAKSPVQTMIMASFIKDNGVESDLNRGNFFGYLGRSGKLEGIALIGHTTLIDATNEDALRAFSIAAKASGRKIHLMMATDGQTEKFWQLYSDGLAEPRMVCKEELFELNFPFFVQDCEMDIRLADEGDLEMVAEAHAEVALLESGIDPMQKDPEGFLGRCLRRIKKGRTFVVFDEGKLLFKADIAAQTEDVIYLEGIYVAEEKRGQGIGAKCLSKLSLRLLDQAGHICLLSNHEFKGAHRSFMKAGYANTGSTTTIFA